MIIIYVVWKSTILFVLQRSAMQGHQEGISTAVEEHTTVTKVCELWTYINTVSLTVRFVPHSNCTTPS